MPQALLGLDLPWINNWLASMNISSTGSLTGAYLQLTSQLPGAGPCYPVWVPTTNIMNRCVPVWPDNITSSLVQVAGNLTNRISAQAANTFKVGNSAQAGAGRQVLCPQPTNRKHWPIVQDVWDSWDQRIARYIGDTARGILIIVVAGLLCSFVSCMVRQGSLEEGICEMHVRTSLLRKCPGTLWAAPDGRSWHHSM